MLLLRLLNHHKNITPILKLLHWLNVNERIEYKLLPSYLNNQISVSTASQYPLLICCHPFSPTNHVFIENHESLIQI